MAKGNMQGYRKCGGFIVEDSPSPTLPLGQSPFEMSFVDGPYTVAGAGRRQRMVEAENVVRSDGHSHVSSHGSPQAPNGNIMSRRHHSQAHNPTIILSTDHYSEDEESLAKKSLHQPHPKLSHELGHIDRPLYKISTTTSAQRQPKTEDLNESQTELPAYAFTDFYYKLRRALRLKGPAQGWHILPGTSDLDTVLHKSDRFRVLESDEFFVMNPADEVIMNDAPTRPELQHGPVGNHPGRFFAQSGPLLRRGRVAPIPRDGCSRSSNEGALRYMENVAGPISMPEVMPVAGHYESPLTSYKESYSLAASITPQIHQYGGVALEDLSDSQMQEACHRWTGNLIIFKAKLEEKLDAAHKANIKLADQLDRANRDNRRLRGEIDWLETNEREPARDSQSLHRQRAGTGGGHPVVGMSDLERKFHKLREIADDVVNTSGMNLANSLVELGEFLGQLHEEEMQIKEEEL